MSATHALDSKTKLDLLRTMLLSREGDRREGILLRQSKGWFQVSGMGHEALAALTLSLRPEDYLFPYYRDRALMLGRGVTNYEMALAYLGKKSSSSGGRQMPGHYSSRELNVFSVCTPTGGSLLPACGTAWGMKLSQKKSICLATVGDASTRQGEFSEAIAFALQEKLPIVFLVEDNKYGISTPTDKFLPFHLNLFAERSYIKLNGRNVDDVYKAGNEAFSKARAGDGPTLIWCDLDRLASHTSSDDHRVYRLKDDIEAMEKRDPIKLFSSEMIAAGLLSSEEFEEMTEKIALEVDGDYLRAEKEADPDPADVLKFAHSDLPEPAMPFIRPGRQTMVSAINTTFAKYLEQDPKVVFFGEDIEDPKGGVFGLTKGLSEKFPNQVFNSPLAEATILGAAVGLSAYGLKPVFELQFIDFISPGWNQIVTNISTLHWRSFGAWNCPMVIYAPYGAYLPGGSIWHSQSNESTLAHAPGINIAIPSTPEDAAGLFATAFVSEDPTFILIPKHIFRKNVEVTKIEPVPLGKAKIIQEGNDITIVTWGNCIELAHEASETVDQSLEIIDLRSIVPCDYEAIQKSLTKTGRLIVVHEDNRRCGFGQTIIAEVTSRPEMFNLLFGAPRLVAREDVHIGFNPIYEYAALPSVADLIEAIKAVSQ